MPVVLLARPARLILLVALALLAVWMALPALAGAQEQPAMTDHPQNTVAVFTLSAAIVLAITQTGIPMAVGLLTKGWVPAWVKAAGMVLLTVVAQVVNVATTMDGTAVISKELVVMAVMGVIASGSLYGHVLKPFGLTNSPSVPNAKLGVTTGIGPARNAA